MPQVFVDGMYDNMWGFMNLDMIRTILETAKCKVGTSEKPDVNNDDFKNALYHNTICFKHGDPSGHYVYVDETGKVTGTYENKLIYRADDGICHGAALISALHNCYPEKFPPLIRNPRGPQQYRYNYGTIMNMYIFLIEQGWWDIALRKHFYKDVHWTRNQKTTKETQNALIILRKFVETL